MKLTHMPEDVPLLQAIIHFTWTCRRSGEESKLRADWWNFDLRQAACIRGGRREWIRRVSCGVYFYHVCVCVYCLPYFCIDFCHYRFSKSSLYIAMIVFMCSVCFQSKCCPFINIDKAHLAICWMLWKQWSEWDQFVISTLVFHFSKWCIMSLHSMMRTVVRMY